MKFARAEDSSKPQSEQINNMILWNHRRFIKFKLKPLLLCKNCNSIYSFHLFFLLLTGERKKRWKDITNERKNVYLHLIPHRVSQNDSLKAIKWRNIDNSRINDHSVSLIQPDHTWLRDICWACPFASKLKIIDTSLMFVVICLRWPTFSNRFELLLDILETPLSIRLDSNSVVQCVSWIPFKVFNVK